MAEPGEYVEQVIIHPTHLSAAQAAELPQKARAGPRRKARDGGMSLADEDGAPEVVREHHLGLIETGTGRVDATKTVFRMPVAAADVIVEAVAVAAEREDGTWLADVPSGAGIITVQHGLGSYDVTVRALDANGGRTGFHAFVPISPDAVEVVPLAGVAQVIVEAVDAQEEATAAASLQG